jgi:hypothetical protein
MSKNRKTVFEALKIKNITKDDDKKLHDVAFKTLFISDYNISGAVLDIIKICGANDTPEIRRIVVVAFKQGEVTTKLGLEIFSRMRKESVDAEFDNEKMYV